MKDREAKSYKSIFTIDDDLPSSPAVMGFRIVSYIKEQNLKKMNIVDIVDHFKEQKWFAVKKLYWSMMFLYSLNIIEFDNSKWHIIILDPQNER